MRFGIKLLLLIVAIAVPAGCVRGSEDGLKNLNELTWEKRIILVREDKNDLGLKQLRQAVDGINERDIVWFRISDDGIETNFGNELHPDLVVNLKSDYFDKFKANVLLIGKDGGVKSAGDRLDLKACFELIDAMPMRKREMKQNLSEKEKQRNVPG